MGRTELRVVGAVVLAAVVPLVVAMTLNGLLVQRVSDVAFNPEFGERLEQSLEVYADLVHALKASAKHATEAIANRGALVDAARRGDAEAVGRELGRALDDEPELHAARVETEDGELVGERTRATAIDETTHRPVTVARPLGGDDAGPTLTAVFALDRTRVDELEGAQAFAQAWRVQATEKDALLVRPYVRAYALVFGLTVLFALVTGILVVRPVTKRINHLAASTRPVAAGDLTVRVPDRGRDEIAALARAFNHMLEALERSRARIEFLQRIGEWQNMARRLAHEIKNPLTPIQLAVEECHRRYDGSDPSFQKLLGTTLDIVTQEVASLRRLVGEFSGFARLPRATPERCDLGDYLRSAEERIRRGEVEGAPLANAGNHVELAFEVEAGPMPVALDREMFHRVLANLVQNAVEALRDADRDGHVWVRARRQGEQYVIDVDDDGPGIPDELKAGVFDPYRTTKKQGTGLGLAIVKKIAIEHGGLAEALDSDAGGARLRVSLPQAGSSAAVAARLDLPDGKDGAPSSRRRGPAS